MENISILSDEDRLKIYETLTKGCIHLWSKGKPQEEKIQAMLNDFSVLAEKDPIFLAHFTSYAIQKLDSKDLKVCAVYAASLSDADGTPFSMGSSYCKPNLRIVAAAAFQHLDPKLALRVVELAASKREFGSKAKATHFSKTLRGAVHKYLRYREANPKSLEGIRKSGLRKTVRALYRLSHLAPSKVACEIFSWKQKDGYPGAGAQKRVPLSFEGMSDLEIAKKIQMERLSPLVVLGVIPKLSPVVAAAILEQCSGDQAIVLTEMFEKEGVLKHPSVIKLYKDKIKTAKTALDRIDRIQSELNTQTSEILKAAKSEKRKNDIGEFGKIFLHIDISSSMQNSILIAKETGSIFAECVKNPQNNFHWGTFNNTGYLLKSPPSFEKDAFHAALYGIRAAGSTDVMANYEASRKLGCDVDVFITDEGHNGRDIAKTVKECRKAGYSDPTHIIVIPVSSSDRKLNFLKQEFERLGIPVTYISPSSLTESALVTQAVKMSLRGAVNVIDEIIKTPLLSLPKWYETVKI